jgi:hypothetical protein
VYCAQKQNTFLTVHQKCVLCTETEHFPEGTSEMFTVYRNRTLSRRYFRNVYCVQKQHFLDGTHKAVFREHKTTSNNLTKRFTVIQIHHHMELKHNKTIHKLYTAGTVLSTPFNLCSVQLLVLRMVADGMK